MVEIKYFIQSLKTQERLNYINQNKILIPDIEIFESINGYDINNTIKALKEMKLKYITLQPGSETYGTLANFLTKVKALQYQIDNNIEYMCLIEDDLLLKKDFTTFIKNNIYLLNDCNMLRLDKWGEGYVTSLNGAKQILKNIYKLGIIENIDNQLRLYSGKEIRLNGTPWELVVPTNKGDCLKTKRISYLNKLYIYYITNNYSALYIIFKYWCGKFINHINKNIIKIIIILLFIMFIIYIIKQKYIFHS